MSINIITQPEQYSSVNRQAILQWHDTSVQNVHSIVAVTINGVAFEFKIFPINGNYKLELSELLKPFSAIETYDSYGLNISDDLLKVQITIGSMILTGGVIEVDELESLTIYFINNVYQIEDLKPEIKEITLLHKGKELTYFKGYPFCLSMLLTNAVDLAYEFVNQTPESLASLPVNSLIHWNISNGILSEDVNENGINQQIIFNEINDFEALIDFNVIENKCGLFLKWYNTSGGWDSFLFNPYYQDSDKVKNEQLINIGEAQELLIKSAKRKLTIKASQLNANQYALVRELAYSKKVMWWINNKFIEVFISPKTKHNSKKLYGELEFTIELPKRYLQ